MIACLSTSDSGYDPVNLWARACGGWWGFAAGPLDSPERHNAREQGQVLKEEFIFQQANTRGAIKKLRDCFCCECDRITQAADFVSQYSALCHLNDIWTCVKYIFVTSCRWTFVISPWSRKSVRISVNRPKVEPTFRSRIITETWVYYGKPGDYVFHILHFRLQFPQFIWSSLALVE